MPYYTRWKRSGIIMKFYGYVNRNEIEEANNEFFTDERSDDAKYQIIDALNITEVECNNSDIKEIAATDKGASIFLQNLKVAYISKKEKVTMALKEYVKISRMLNSSWKFKGFKEMGPAIRWAERSEMPSMKKRKIKKL